MLWYSLNPAPENQVIILVGKGPNVFVRGEIFYDLQRFLLVVAKCFKFVEILFVVEKVFYVGFFLMKVILQGLPGLIKVIFWGICFLD